MIFRLLALTLALALGGPAQAQLYKWVDSEGKVQYSDRPPPPGATKEQKLNIKNPPPAATAEGEPPAEAKSYTEKEMEYRKRKVEEEQARQKSQAEEKENQQLCAGAQRRLRTYEEAGRIYTMDDKGERSYVDDQARERGLQQAQQDIAKYCK